MTNEEVFTLQLPRIDAVIHGANPDEPSDEHDIAYNQWCNDRIRETIRANVAAGHSGRIKTKYPFDTPETMDTLELDEDGEIVVVDSGSA